MRARTGAAIAGCLAIALGALAGMPAQGPQPYAYHLRVVRVSGAFTDPGAAVGWAENGGIPVLLPTDEAWGSPEQLQALAATLRGERAEAVTGFFVTADEHGATFDRRVYLGERVLDLSFEAVPPIGERQEHLLTMRIDSPEWKEPIAEARLLARTARTVAIAAPSPEDGDWLVLAVTPVDQGTLSELNATWSRIRTADDEGIQQPKVIRKTSPRYPDAARRDKLTGHVAVITMIDTRGVPHAPMVLGMSPGGEELAAAAVEAVKSWRFEPARLEGQPVDLYYAVFVEFKLE